MSKRKARRRKPLIDIYAPPSFTTCWLTGQTTSQTGGWDGLPTKGRRVRRGPEPGSRAWIEKFLRDIKIIKPRTKIGTKVSLRIVMRLIKQILDQSEKLDDLESREPFGRYED